MDTGEKKLDNQEQEATQNVVNFSFPIADPNGMIEGKFFDAVAAGDWRDMYGRDFKLAAADLPDMVANTKRAIASATTADGELVGLPIDRLNHERGLAAGWIVDVRLGEGGVIQAKAMWNSHGASLIKDGNVRHFSATLYPEKKVIVGGSLVNWSAQVYSDGRRALRPISLGAEPPDALEIVMTQSSGVEFDEEAFADRLRQQITGDLTNVVGAMLANFMGAKDGSAPGSGSDENGEQPNLIEAFELGEAMEKMAAAVKAQLAAAYLNVQKQGNQYLETMLAAANRDARITDLAGQLTAGGSGARRVLATPADKLKDWLLSLNQPQLDFAKELLTGITAGNALVDLAEYGSDQEKKGGTEKLPKVVLDALLSGKLTVADLSSPILNLGDIDRYDLSAFTGGKR